jgi:hypothetical protein
MSRYISLRAVHRLFGTHYPYGAGQLAETLEKYLTHAIVNGERFPETLLEHNVSGRRNRALCEFAPVDVDIVHTVDIATRQTNWELKDFRRHTQFARPVQDRRVVFHTIFNYPDHTRWAIELPLQALMKGFGDPEEGYQCYSHSIGLEDSTTGKRLPQNYYCGITSRNWLKRMAEHQAEIRSGSNKTFHRAWREYQGRSGVVFYSELIVLNHTFEAAMGWEEFIVDRIMAEGKSLNMIPGGFKGLRMLHTLGHLNRTTNISLKERDLAMATYARGQARTGVPNLLIAGLWQDDAFYARVIGGRSDTLSAEQVRRIRRLNSEGLPPQQIAADVSARNIEQVKRVIKHKTYTRMH